MANETRAYRRLRGLFPQAHWQRLETWTGSGVFDVNGCLQGVEAWVECKEGTDPKTDRGLVRTKVRPAQVAWEFLRRQAAGRTFVALIVGDQLHLLPGHTLRELKKGVTRKWISENKISFIELFSR